MMWAVVDGTTVGIAVVAAVVFGIVGYAAAAYLSAKKAKQTQSEADTLLEKARRDAESIRKEANVEAEPYAADDDADHQADRHELDWRP